MILKIPDKTFYKILFLLIMTSEKNSNAKFQGLVVITSYQHLQFNT